MVALIKYTFIISLIPSLIIGMDKNNSKIVSSNSCYSIYLNPSPDLLTLKTNRFYTNASTTIHKFQANNEDSIKGLLIFMKSVQKFKNNNATIDEYYLGSLAYTKTISVKESLLGHPHPHHVALFFKRLKIYNDTLTNVTKISPTLDEWKSSLFNKDIKNKQSKALQIASDNFGITIKQNEINYTKPPFQFIPDNVAITEFKKLCKNIENLINTKNEITLKSLVDLIYLNPLGQTETEK